MESSELIRQAYGCELFTGPVELVVKRAAVLLEGIEVGAGFVFCPGFPAGEVDPDELVS